MRRNKNPLPPKPLTREQELLQEFQQGEAADQRSLEPVDKQMRNVRRTWAELAGDTSDDE